MFIRTFKDAIPMIVVIIFLLIGIFLLRDKKKSEEVPFFNLEILPSGESGVEIKRLDPAGGKSWVVRETEDYQIDPVDWNYEEPVIIVYKHSFRANKTHHKRIYMYEYHFDANDDLEAILIFVPIKGPANE